MDADDTVSVLAALAQPTRLKIVQHLSANKATGLTTGQLAELVATPMNTMSGHLGILANAGLVTSARSGRNITYKVVTRLLTEASDLIGAMVNGRT